MKKSLLILLLIALPVMTFAQTDIGFYGVGAKLGYVMPEDPIESTLGFGLAADLGTITPAIALEAFVDYWAKKYDEGSGSIYGGDWETTFSVFSIGALGKYYFETSNQFEPFVGAGLSLNFASAKSEYSYTNPYTGQTTSESADHSESDIGINLVGGAKMEVSPKMDGFAEVKYVISDVDYFGIFVGVMYKLGN